MTKTYPMLTIKDVKIRRLSMVRYYDCTLFETVYDKNYPRIMKQIGLCIKAGGTVDVRVTQDKFGRLFLSGTLDWRPQDV